MLPDLVSNPGPQTYESGALLIALRGPAQYLPKIKYDSHLEIILQRKFLGLSMYLELLLPC